MSVPHARLNPLQPGKWTDLGIVLKGDGDEGSDGRGRFLSAHQRPYDAVESEVAPVRPAFPSSPSEAFAGHLDRGMGTHSAPTAAPVMTFDVAFLKLLDEHPAACLAVVLCYTEGLTERAAAQEIRVSPGLVNRRKLCGLGHLAAWTGRPTEEIAVLLEDLGRAARGPAGQRAGNRMDGGQG